MRRIYLYKICHIIILLLFCCTGLKSEIYSSVQHLRKAFTLESKISDVLSNYVTKTEQKLEAVKRYLENYEQVTEESKMLQITDENKKDSELNVEERLAGNPLQVFHLMKRLTIDLQHLKKQDPTSDWKEVLKALEAEFDSSLPGFNDEEELRGAAQAIVVLQSYYNLNATSLIEGNIAGTQMSSKLTAFDCLYLGRYAYRQNMLPSAVLWYEQAYYIAGLENNKTLSQDVALRYLNKAYQEFFESEPPNEKAVFFANELLSMTEKLVEMNKISFKEGDVGDFVESHRNFEALCRGEQFLSEKYIAKLKCYYDTRNSPYFILMPSKVEQKHIDPEILIFYDVIGDKVIEKIKAYADPWLSRGEVIDKRKENGEATSQARVAKVTWLNTMLEGVDYQKMEMVIEELTGLITRQQLSSELLQVGNYGTGGLYNPHPDYVIGPSADTGNRIATFMYYLSDVEKGGATVFPRLGVILEPVKGAAAFWYNIRKSGMPDFDTFHGGCPVVIGSKWVANKWIKERAQFLKRPCGLDIQE